MRLLFDPGRVAVEPEHARFGRRGESTVKLTVGQTGRLRGDNHGHGRGVGRPILQQDCPARSHEPDQRLEGGGDGLVAEHRLGRRVVFSTVAVDLDLPEREAQLSLIPIADFDRRWPPTVRR